MILIHLLIFPCCALLWMMVCDRIGLIETAVQADLAQSRTHAPRALVRREPSGHVTQPPDSGAARHRLRA